MKNSKSIPPMTINSMKYLFTAASMMLLALPTVAQNVAQPDTAELKGERVVVDLDHRPEIMESEKNDFQPALLESRPTQSDEFKYETVTKQVDTQFELRPIKPARMKGVPLKPLERGYVKGGLGNHLTTLGEVYINNVRSRNRQLGFKGTHLASRGNVLDKGFSGFSENSASVFGKKYLKTHLIEGGINYDRNVVHYYDYDPEVVPAIERTDTRQRYQTIGSHAQLMSFFKDSTMLNYDLHLNYYRINDRFGATENNVRLNAAFDKYIGKEHYTLDAVVDYNKYSNATGLAENSIVGATPNVISKGKRWRLKVGLSVFTEVSTVAKFHFYPDAYFKYNVVEEMLIPYLGVTGGLQRNSFKSFTDENAFMRSDFQLLNSNTKYDLFGGVRGAFSSTTSFNLRASSQRIADMPLYVNDETSTFNQFMVIYDTVNVLNLRAEAAYRKGQKLHLLLRGDYWNYNPDNEFVAWHMPEFKATLIGRYNLKDKIVATADIFYISGQKAKSSNPEDGEDLSYGVYAKDLKGVVDMNIGLEYRYNKRLSAWLQFNNLGGFRYNRWNGYPTQRFTALGGITYSFWGKK